MQKMSRPRGEQHARTRYNVEAAEARSVMQPYFWYLGGLMNGLALKGFRGISGRVKRCYTPAGGRVKDTLFANSFLRLPAVIIPL